MVATTKCESALGLLKCASPHVDIVTVEYIQTNLLLSLI